MSDLLGDAATWMEEQRHEHLTREVVYARGFTQVTVKATIGRTEFEVTTQHGALTRIESRDFLITAASLVAVGAPVSGDRITEGGQVYEVLHPAGAAPWRWSDQNRITYRIHTKHVGAAS